MPHKEWQLPMMKSETNTVLQLAFSYCSGFFDSKNTPKLLCRTASIRVSEMESFTKCDGDCCRHVAWLVD